MALMTTMLAAKSTTSVGGAGTAGSAGIGVGGAALGALQIGLAAYQFSNTLSAVKSGSSDARAQAQAARLAAIENNKLETFKINLTSFRRLSTMTAQASSGGFSGGSASTLAIKNQQQNGADRLVTQSNKKLQDRMREIQRQESAVLRKLRGMKSSGIAKLAITAVGVVAAPFTGGASLAVAGAAQAAV